MKNKYIEKNKINMLIFYDLIISLDIKTERKKVRERERAGKLLGVFSSERKARKKLNILRSFVRKRGPS